MPDGSKRAIMLHFDRNITPDMSEPKVKQRNQLCDWMENDLLEILSDAGYDTTSVSKDATSPGAGRYVLRYYLARYNPGSKAARTFVGFGAGGAEVEITYSLEGVGNEVIIAGQQSSFSGRDWTNAAHKVNTETVKEVNSAFK